MVGIYSLKSLPKNLTLNFVNLMDTSVELLVHISYGINVTPTYFNVEYHHLGSFPQKGT